MVRVLKLKPRPAPSTVAVRHEFAIGPASRGDPFDGKGQRYTCIRCKWAFVIKGRQVVVLDDRGTPMTREQGLKRLNTFSDGPCPAIRW